MRVYTEAERIDRIERAIATKDFSGLRTREGGEVLFLATRTNNTTYPIAGVVVIGSQPGPASFTRDGRKIAGLEGSNDILPYDPSRTNRVLVSWVRLKSGAECWWTNETTSGRDSDIRGYNATLLASAWVELTEGQIAREESAPTEGVTS